MDTDRLLNSAVDFGVARLLRGHRAGVRTGTGMGVLSAAASGMLWDRYEEANDAGDIEGVPVPIEEPSASA